jgi:hypothetical protein
VGGGDGCGWVSRVLVRLGFPQGGGGLVGQCLESDGVLSACSLAPAVGLVSGSYGDFQGFETSVRSVDGT